jgi:hypothetical protein
MQDEAEPREMSAMTLTGFMPANLGIVRIDHD